MAESSYPKAYLYRRIVQAKLFIDEHYAQDIDLENIADEAYFSKFHFIRTFNKIYGKTPRQYLISVRVEKACRMLGEGAQVTDACYAVGFKSPGTFSSLFKKIKGITPSAYLQEQQQLKTSMRESPLRFIPGCHVVKNIG